MAALTNPTTCLLLVQNAFELILCYALVYEPSLLRFEVLSVLLKCGPRTTHDIAECTLPSCVHAQQQSGIRLSFLQTLNVLVSWLRLVRVNLHCDNKSV